MNVRQYCERCRKVHWIYRQAAPVGAPEPWTRGTIIKGVLGGLALALVYVALPWWAYLVWVKP
jgi:hypothetical protein